MSKCGQYAQVPPRKPSKTSSQFSKNHPLIERPNLYYLIKRLLETAFTVS